MKPKLLTLDDLPEGWIKWDYQEAAMKGKVRLAVFKDFRMLPENKGYGTYDFVSGRGGNWEQLCAGLESREHAVHVLVTHVLLGAYDAYTK